MQPLKCNRLVTFDGWQPLAVGATPRSTCLARQLVERVVRLGDLGREFVEVPALVHESVVARTNPHTVWSLAPFPGRPPH